MQVSEVLRVKGHRLVTVDPSTSLSDCVATMAEHDIGSLAVIEHGALVGMLTFREVLRVLARRRCEQAADPGAPVADPVAREVMNKSPYVAAPQMEVNELRQIMIEHRERYLPVIEDEVLLGVVSFHDVARAVLEEKGFENRISGAYIRDWPLEG